MDRPAGAVFEDPEQYATCLVTVGVARYGGECLSWVPDTWIHHVKDDFGVVIPQRNIDRLMGAVVVLTRPDEFYGAAAGFNDIAQAIASEWFDTHVWHPPTTEECLWAVVESYLLDPPDDRNAPRFAEEVRGFVTSVARSEGFPTLPKSFAAFGLTEDSSVPPSHDYSGDPELLASVAEAVRTREADLGSFLVDRLSDLSARIRTLPIDRRKADATASDIEGFINRREPE